MGVHHQEVGFLLDTYIKSKHYVNVGVHHQEEGSLLNAHIKIKSTQYVNKKEVMGVHHYVSTGRTHIKSIEHVRDYGCAPPRRNQKGLYMYVTGSGKWGALI